MSSVSSGLGPLARLVLYIAREWTDDGAVVALVTVAEVAEAMGVHYDTARRALSEVVEAGWLSTTPRGGRGLELAVVATRPRSKPRGGRELLPDETATRPPNKPVIHPLSDSPLSENTTERDTPQALISTNEGTRRNRDLESEEYPQPKSERERRPLSASLLNRERWTAVAERLERLCIGEPRDAVWDEVVAFVVWADNGGLGVDPKLVDEVVGYASVWENRPHWPVALESAVRTIAGRYEVRLPRFERPGRR